MVRSIRVQQAGFTLIELLVVIGLLSILLTITLIALNPTQHFQNTRDTQRRSDVAAVLDAIYEYQAANGGSLPTGLGSLTAGTAYALSTTGTNHVDLCSTAADLLVPTYLADMPSDPAQTTPRTPAKTNCRSATAYTTGYTLTKGSSGRFTVTAPLAENGTISVTR